MSQSSANARTLRTHAPARAPEVMAPQFRVVQGTKGEVRRAVVPLVLVALVILLLAIVAPLIINTNMAQTAYDIRDQRVVLAEKTAIIDTLQVDILEVKSPAALRAKAIEIGMVPSAPVGVISLDLRQVTGGSAAQ